MKVSKHSWHYRLYVRLRSVYEGEPIIGKSKFFGWLLFPFTMVRLFQPISKAVREGIDYTAPRSLCSYFWQIVGMTLFTIVLWPLSFIFVVALCAPYAILLGLILAIVATYRYIKSRKQAKPEPSLVLEFIKAKKSRVCPLLIYED